MGFHPTTPVGGNGVPSQNLVKAGHATALTEPHFRVAPSASSKIIRGSIPVGRDPQGRVTNTQSPSTKVADIDLINWLNSGFAAQVWPSDASDAPRTSPLGNMDKTIP